MREILRFQTVSQWIERYGCHSERSEESNDFKQIEYRDSSAVASE